MPINVMLIKQQRLDGFTMRTAYLLFYFNQISRQKKSNFKSLKCLLMYLSKAIYGKFQKNEFTIDFNKQNRPQIAPFN